MSRSGIRWMCLVFAVSWTASMSRAIPGDPVPRSRNLLIVVADDLGVDLLATYGEGSDVPSTPVIDGLRARGVLFRNAWSNPVCSSTRATIQTGRYGFRTGVGFIAGTGTSLESTLPLSEDILPEILDRSPGVRITHAAVGKWHLSNESNSPGGPGRGPNDAGYGHYSGALFNLSNYFRWGRTVDGDTEICGDIGGDDPCPSGAYATSVEVNDAIVWINLQSDPWFLWLAFNAPHSPFQAPPRDLHTLDLPVPPRQRCPPFHERPCYLAMIEALDKELGRLFAGIRKDTLDETTIIFLGDNGTPGTVTVPPFFSDHAKGTLYEGGINVPMIVAGPPVRFPGSECPALVTTADLFLTSLEILLHGKAKGVLAGDRILDSVSLLPLLRGESGKVRPFAFAELFRTPPDSRDGKTVRNERYKLVYFELHGREELYDLEMDPFEQHDLMLEETLDREQRRNLHRLRQALRDLLGS